MLVSQRASKRHYIKVTYYVDPALVKRLKTLGVEEDRDLSDLVNEAISDLLGNGRGVEGGGRPDKVAERDAIDEEGRDEG